MSVPTRTFSLPTSSSHRDATQHNLLPLTPTNPSSPTAPPPRVTSREKSFASHPHLTTSPHTANNDITAPLFPSSNPQNNLTILSMNMLEQHQRRDEPYHYVQQHRQNHLQEQPSQQHPQQHFQQHIQKHQQYQQHERSRHQNKLTPSQRQAFTSTPPFYGSASTNSNLPYSKSLPTSPMKTATRKTALSPKPSNAIHPMDGTIFGERHSLDEVGSTPGASASTHILEEDQRHSAESVRQPTPDDVLSDVSDSRFSDGSRRRRTSTSSASASRRQKAPVPAPNPNLTTIAVTHLTPNANIPNAHNSRSKSTHKHQPHHFYDGDSQSADRVTLRTSNATRRSHQRRYLAAHDNHFQEEQQYRNHQHKNLPPEHQYPDHTQSRSSTTSTSPSVHFAPQSPQLSQSYSAAQLGQHHRPNNSYHPDISMAHGNLNSPAFKKSSSRTLVQNANLNPESSDGRGRLSNDVTSLSRLADTVNTSTVSNGRAMTPLSLTTEESLGFTSTTFAATPTTTITNSNTTTTNPSTIETIRRPILYFAKYGAPSTWALDVFTLPHNAVRSECIDLYNILESIHARSHRVCAVELEEFYLWWAVFEAFLIEYFDFEADVLFSWVFPVSIPSSALMADGVRPLPDVAARKANADATLRSSLLTKKDELLDSIRQLNGTFELRRHVDTTDVYQTIVEDVNAFIPKLLEYFHTQERHLPQIAAQLYTPTSRDLIVKKYVQYIKRGESPQMNLVLLSKWMDADVRDKWVRANVKGYWRLVHRRLEKRCHRTHVMIATRFKKRLQRSVRSTAASRLRRRTEFGEEIDELSFGSAPSQAGSVKSLSLVIGGGVWGGGKDMLGRQKGRSRKDNA